MNNLSGKLVIVTGAGRGNGKAIAEGLSNHGADVWGVDLKFESAIDHNVRKIVGDVTDQELIFRVKEEASDLTEEIVLINNAGITFPAKAPYPISDWEKTLSVNLTAPFMWIESISQIMVAQKCGSIINITSLCAERAFADNPAYIASKGGLKMLTKAYAKSLGSYGIRANNVGPGYILTDMTRESYQDENSKKVREKHTLMGRWGTPSDLVGICIFLASEAAAYITGQDIYVDGGWLSNGMIT